MWVNRTMVISDAVAPLCRQLAESVAHDAGANMWITPLSANGQEPATHWISAGMIDGDFADMIASPESLSVGAGIPINEAAAILSQCDVSEEDPMLVMSRLGLTMCSSETL